MSRNCSAVMKKATMSPFFISPTKLKSILASTQIMAIMDSAGIPKS